MICPKCKADIPDDSWFCDQCGSELKFCPNCLVPAKGKRCTRCGAVLVSASALNKNVSSNPPVSPGPVSQQASITDSPCTKSDSATMRPETSSGLHIPDTEPTRLVMMDCPSKIVLLKDKAIIGRTKGDYLNVFSNQPYVSGTHAQIILHSSLKWLIEDLGSTNGTKIENTPLIPHKSYQLKKGQTVEIGFVKFRVE